MLKTTRQADFQLGDTMPVDFTAYLLSSSPPASGFEFVNCGYSPQFDGFTTNGHPFSPRKTSTSYTRKCPSPLKPIIIRNISTDEDKEEDGTLSPTSPSSPGRNRKKVSFADHRGMALATVRIMTEPSDMPPKLRPEILSSITKGAKAGVTEEPPLVLNFSQPASDYMAFRDRVGRDCVCLENVILRDYDVLGTIKVKNIHFDKNVFLRYTADSWESSTDVDAVYAPNPCDSYDNRLDTFSFKFSVPTNFDVKKKIEFVVCFECKGQQYWDNNGGQNYGILSFDFTEPSTQKPTDITTVKNVAWPDFACWNNLDTTQPYW